jgi:glycogen debranching enzyme
MDVDPEGEATSRIHTVDGLLGVLVTGHADRADRVFDALVDPDEYGTPFGPPGVHPAEPTYDPDAYWRGGTWPPWNYLLRTAADRQGREAHAVALDNALVAGARTSGFSEYWHPMTGAGRGAQPQSWSCLAIVPRLLASPEGPTSSASTRRVDAPGTATS